MISKIAFIAIAILTTILITVQSTTAQQINPTACDSAGLDAASHACYLCKLGFGCDIDTSTGNGTDTRTVTGIGTDTSTGELGGTSGELGGTSGELVGTSGELVGTA
jgi:hypothetical protein